MEAIKEAVKEAATAAKSLRILILEDIPTDAELVERALHQAGLRFTAKRVDTRDAFIRALEEFRPDIILSDYKLPGFDALSAMKLVRQKSADLPVILVTGILGDEAAVELVRAGANDYILKDRVARLGFAVQRTLAEAEESRSRRQAEAALKASEIRYRRLFETAQDGILILDAGTGRIVDINQLMIDLFGYSREEYSGKTLWDIEPFKDSQFNKAAFKDLQERGYIHYEDMPLEAKDGRQLRVELISNLYKADDREIIQCNIRDITERRRTERALARVNRALRTLGSGNEALVRAAREPELLQEMCRVLVEVGGYRMAWIGIAEHDEDRTVRPVAWAGRDAGYIEHAKVSWKDSERGCGPTGAAIRTAEPQVDQDLATDQRMSPWRVEALKRGYASAVALPLRDNSRVFGALTIYAAERDAFSADELRLLARLTDDLSYGVVALHNHAEREAAVRRLDESLEDTIGAVASTVEKRDPYTAGHQRRVAKLAAAIAQEIGLAEDQARGVFLAGLIHDVGKINVPAEILSKPGKLMSVEFQLIQIHPQTGYEVIRGVEFPWPIAQAVLQHHERLDGSGYPNGLTDEAIIVEAKILAVADVVEAITAHRPYRPALGLDVALDEIEKGRGRLYDPAAVDACIALFRKKGFNFQ